eukprot:scaffold119144_cov22-Tisochrysis_lutea.AAC.1
MTSTNVKTTHAHLALGNDHRVMSSKWCAQEEEEEEEEEHKDVYMYGAPHATTVHASSCAGGAHMVCPMFEIRMPLSVQNEHEMTCIHDVLRAPTMHTSVRAG